MKYTAYLQSQSATSIFSKQDTTSIETDTYLIDLEQCTSSNSTLSSFAVQAFHLLTSVLNQPSSLANLGAVFFPFGAPELNDAAACDATAIFVSASYKIPS